MNRRQGWEARLAAVLEAARGAPYELGRHDCFRVVCQAVEALTGEDLWAPFAGSYRTEAQALRRIAAYGGGSFDGAFSRLFCSEPVLMPQARIGDVVKIVDKDRVPHLGVCVGAEVAFLAPAGLVFLPRSECACAWRIG